MGAGRGSKFAAFAGLSLVGGASAVLGVDPGYQRQPVPLALAGVCACMCVPLVRGLVRDGTRALVIGVVGLGAAGVAAGWLYAQAPKAIDRHAYTSVERALLARIAAFAGSPGRPRTAPSTGSDWGISFLNPPDTYLTSRVDALPASARLPQVARFYAAQLERAGLDVSRVRLHTPPEEEEVDGQRGAVLISAVIGPTSVQLTARCQRNGPSDPGQTEPPCRADN